MNAYTVTTKTAFRKPMTFIQFSNDMAEAEASAPKNLVMRCPTDDEVIDTVVRRMPTSEHEIAVFNFAALLQHDLHLYMSKCYPESYLTANWHSWQVFVKFGLKYVNVDIGTSGRYMITPEGDIYGIKAYGVINKIRHYGTLSTTTDWFWGDYKAAPGRKSIPMPEPSFSLAGIDHPYVNSNPGVGFDNDCSICGGKCRDSIHGPDDETRVRRAEDHANAHEKAASKSSRGLIALSDEVKDVLRNANIQGAELRLTRQLDRGLYQDVNKALEALGGKWIKSKRCHVFSGDVKDAIEQAIDEGRVVNKSKALNQFFTPPDIARKLVDLSNLEDGCRVLEPSAGSGRILDAIIESGLNTLITAVEIDPVMCDLLAERYAAKAILLRGNFFSLGKYTIGGPFDRIIMNPPFENGADVDHIRHAAGFLAKGGILSALCCNGPRQQAAFRDAGHYWDVLPERSFASAGTNVSVAMTVITA